MQFKKDQKLAIQAGTQTVTFRRWVKPQARTGGHYNIPPCGAIEVTEVAEIELSDISGVDAAAAGYESMDALRTRLSDATRPLYRIRFVYLGTDAVKVPDRSTPDGAETQALIEKLQRMDRKQPWAVTTLGLIRDHPGTRAADLAVKVDQDTATFKRNVRKLKQLGLTISLEVGYKLSPRGVAVLSETES